MTEFCNTSHQDLNVCHERDQEIFLNYLSVYHIDKNERKALRLLSKQYLIDYIMSTDDFCSEDERMMYKGHIKIVYYDFHDYERRNKFEWIIKQEEVK